MIKELCGIVYFLVWGVFMVLGVEGVFYWEFYLLFRLFVNLNVMVLEF